MALMPFSRDLFSMPDPFGSDPFGALMRPLTDTTLGAMAMAPRGMPLDVVEVSLPALHRQGPTPHTTAPACALPTALNASKAAPCLSPIPCYHLEPVCFPRSRAALSLACLFTPPVEYGSLTPSLRGPGCLQKDDSFEIRADVPGVNKDNISVTVDQGNVLNIKVDQKAEKREEGAKWHRYERTQSFVQRALRMPETADLDNIKARYENGVLQLDMPKKPTGKEQKRIDVA